MLVIPGAYGDHWLVCPVHLLDRIYHCTIAAFIVLGLVAYLGVIGCTSK